MSAKAKEQVKPAKRKVVEKVVRHVFTEEQKSLIGQELARYIGELRGIANEFDQVKAAYKAKQAEAEAKVDSLATGLINGFEMRNKRCVVILRPKERKKFFVAVDEWESFENPEEELDRMPVSLVEEMTPQDFQADLLEAEAEFESRQELDLFTPTADTRGALVVGKFGGKWFTALKMKLGKWEVMEKLSHEGRAYKKREDAIQLGVKLAMDWIESTNGKEVLEGFRESMLGVAERERGKEE